MRTAAASGRRALACRQKLLELFPDGFGDDGFLETQRAYKWQAEADPTPSICSRRRARSASLVERLRAGVHAIGAEPLAATAMLLVSELGVTVHEAGKAVWFNLEFPALEPVTRLARQPRGLLRGNTIVATSPGTARRTRSLICRR